jgi:hypothetical protein
MAVAPGRRMACWHWCAVAGTPEFSDKYEVITAMVHLPTGGILRGDWSTFERRPWAAMFVFAHAWLTRCQLTAAPTVSAITAPRAPSGFSWPTVESRAVWCSTSELSSAPTSTTMVESHIHIIRPTTAPSAP